MEINIEKKIILEDILFQKPGVYKIVKTIIWYVILCLAYYIDVGLDIFLCIEFAIKAKWLHFTLTLIFICAPILFTVFVLHFQNKRQANGEIFIKRISLLYQ